VWGCPGLWWVRQLASNRHAPRQEHRQRKSRDERLQETKYRVNNSRAEAEAHRRVKATSSTACQAASSAAWPASCSM
jgi:hypothetical protein